MRATGIVRKIDELGRVVIPKEIRKTMKIREGDPLEIFTNNEGSVIFKKYSPINELRNFAGIYADALFRSIRFPIFICDKDYVVSATGFGKTNYIDRRITSAAETIYEANKVYLHEKGAKEVHAVEDMDNFIVCLVPITVDGDVSGSIMVLSTENEKVFPKEDLNAIKTAAEVLGKQMEL